MSISAQTLQHNLYTAKEYVRKLWSNKPTVGVILGSGLSSFADQIENSVCLPFADIPHFAPSTVAGHPGCLVLGQLHGLNVAVLQGRIHAYEGHPWSQIVFPVRLLAQLGINTLLVTNAAGGLKRTQKPGDFLLLRDQINFTGGNALVGANLDSLGPRFVDMTEPFDRELTDLLAKVLRAQKVRFQQGVYCGVLGPSYETAAEIKMFARLGGSAVGMSTVQEVIAARHAGIRVVGLSCITNLGTGLSRTKLSHEDVKIVAARAEKQFIAVLNGFLLKAKSKLLAAAKA